MYLPPLPAKHAPASGRWQAEARPTKAGTRGVVVGLGLPPRAVHVEPVYSSGRLGRSMIFYYEGLPPRRLSRQFQSVCNANLFQARPYTYRYVPLTWTHVRTSVQI